MHLDLKGPAGRLEALIESGTNTPRAAVVFGHPHPMHGGTMHTKAVYQGTKGLARIGCAVLRFNFRGVGLSEGLSGTALAQTRSQGGSSAAGQMST